MVQRRKVLAIISLAALAFTIIVKKRTFKKKRLWARSWLLKRDEGTGRGTLAMVRDELRLLDETGYKNYLRMDYQIFSHLLQIISPSISKKNTTFRQCITAEDRLMVTLRYLATGETLKSLSYSTRIAHNTLSVIINEVLLAIVAGLQNTYLKVPETQEEWMTIATTYEKLWNFPHCVGAMDGKHITFRPLRADGSFYHNYKGSDSIVLMAVVDANYKFLVVDIGKNGRVSDGGVFQRSTLAHAINSNGLKLPSPAPLLGRTTAIPYVFVADDAFPLKENIMKPYKFHGLSNKQRIYNYRICRARRVVENAFGILCNRFRILLNTMNVKVEKVELITRVCCILHNYLITTSPKYVDSIEDENLNCMLNNLTKQGGNRCSKSAQDIRIELEEYFNSTGAVAWQQNSVANYV